MLIMKVLCNLVFKRGEENGTETGTSEIEETIEETEELISTETEEESVDYFANEVDKDDAEGNTGNAIKVVVDGFKMMVPIEYNCLYTEEVGVVVYMDDVFHMKLAVSDKGYDVIKADPEMITEKAVAAGGEILQDVKFEEIDGKEYVYYLLHLEGSDCFVAYTQAVDQDKCVACQMVIEKEDLLNIFASVASTAVVTDEANSTQEDIHEEIRNANFGERKTESSLTFEGETVTFGVPAEFYGQGTDSWGYYATEMFSTTDYVSVDCFLYSTNTGEYDGAESYIANQMDFASEEDGAVEKMDVNGTTFYYFTEDYEYDGSRFQKIYAACNIGETGIYVVELSAIDVDREINVELIEEFLYVK